MQHSGSLVFTMAGRLFSRGMRDIIPGPGSKPGPLRLELGRSATGPSGKSLVITF